MSECIHVPNGIICMSKVDFNCPACGEEYHEADYYRRLEKSKYGFIYTHCKRCGTLIGISLDITGDVVAWGKVKEPQQIKE